MACAQDVAALHAKIPVPTAAERLNSSIPALPLLSTTDLLRLVIAWIATLVC